MCRIEGESFAHPGRGLRLVALERVGFGEVGGADRLVQRAFAPLSNFLQEGDSFINASEFNQHAASRSFQSNRMRCPAERSFGPSFRFREEVGAPVVKRQAGERIQCARHLTGRKVRRFHQLSPDSFRLCGVATFTMQLRGGREQLGFPLRITLEQRFRQAQRLSKFLLRAERIQLVGLGVKGPLLRARVPLRPETPKLQAVVRVDITDGPTVGRQKVKHDVPRTVHKTLTRKKA